ncbi:unnamed protein product [Oppiella nova]|uniref:Uncharacterized protein n=1 Tax=Oppiella nova TaxID=334625 RepID=A0A7R9LML2_9ACAR|nr:unnamed protein product [Oppiella nova]CAG2164755.1 unnamed protein product [Oppiella nova]
MSIWDYYIPPTPTPTPATTPTTTKTTTTTTSPTPTPDSGEIVIDSIEDIEKNVIQLTNKTNSFNELQTTEDLIDVIEMIDKMSEYLQTNGSTLNETMAMNISQHFITLISQTIEQNVWMKVNISEQIELASKLHHYEGNGGDMYSCVSLKHKNRLVLGDRVLCVFWDFDRKKWSSDGCRLIESESNRETTKERKRERGSIYSNISVEDTRGVDR